MDEDNLDHVKSIHTDEEDINNKHWQDLRRERLKKTPLCEACMSQARGSKASLESATEVYRIPSGDANSYWWVYTDLGRLISLCASCYGYVTRAEAMGDQPYDWGTGIDGWPVDPRHRFYDPLTRIHRSRE